MKYIYHNKRWLSGAVRIHADSPPTPLIKIEIGKNSEKYYIKIKLCRNPMLEACNMYELKMALFENEEPKYFLLFQWTYHMMFGEPGNITVGIKIQYLHNVIRGEELHELKTLCKKIGNSNNTHIKHIILGLCLYSFQ